MDIVQLISAAGIGGIVGSLLTTLAQAWFSNKQYVNSRNFQEKKEAYIGLLEAYRAACFESGKDKEKKLGDFAYWSVRCALVSPKEICSLVEQMKTSDTAKQSVAFKELQNLMRKDLGVG